METVDVWNTIGMLFEFQVQETNSPEFSIAVKMNPQISDKASEWIIEYKTNQIKITSNNEVLYLIQEEDFHQQYFIYENEILHQPIQIELVFQEVILWMMNLCAFNSLIEIMLTDDGLLTLQPQKSELGKSHCQKKISDFAHQCFKQPILFHSNVSFKYAKTFSHFPVEICSLLLSQNAHSPFVVDFNINERCFGRIYCRHNEPFEQ